MGNSDAYELML